MGCDVLTLMTSVLVYVHATSFAFPVSMDFETQILCAIVTGVVACRDLVVP